MLQEGARVSRQAEIGKPERRYGNVVRKYRTRQTSSGPGFFLYDVLFDGETEPSIGHLEECLQKENK